MNRADDDESGRADGRWLGRLLLGALLAACTYVIELLLGVGPVIAAAWIGFRIAGAVGAVTGFVLAVGVVLIVAYALVTRTPPAASFAQQIGFGAGVFALTTLFLGLGWTVGSLVSDIGAIVGLLLGAAIAAIIAVVLWSRRPKDGFLASLRRASARKHR